MRTVHCIVTKNDVILYGKKREMAYTKSRNLRVKRSMKIKQKPGEKHK